MSHITGDTASLWTGVKMVQILKFEVGKGFPVPDCGPADE